MNTVKNPRNLRFLAKLKDAPKKSLEIYKIPEPDWRAMGSEIILGKGVYHWLQDLELDKTLSLQFIKWRASKKQKELIRPKRYFRGERAGYHRYHWLADVMVSAYKFNACPYYDYKGKYKYLRKQLKPF